MKLPGKIRRSLKSLAFADRAGSPPPMHSARVTIIISVLALGLHAIWATAKSSLRGGFGLSYEGTLYNPLSNSRWNLPYYSFNFADNALNGDVNTVIYGPYHLHCDQLVA